MSINALAMALAAKDVKLAMSLLTGVEDALSPAGTIVRDAFLKGGRLGADQIKKVLA